MRSRHTHHRRPCHRCPCHRCPCHRSPRRGLTLLLVLWIVVILGAITMAAVTSARRANGVAANFRARAVARTSAESGITVGVQALSAVVASSVDTIARRDALNALDRLPSISGEIPLGGGRLTVAVQDIGTLLDVNLASDDQLARFFAQFVSPNEAAVATEALRAYRKRPARMLGALEELRAVPGLSSTLLDRALPYLTVDGDGTINRRTASDTVRSVAGGELRDEPSRVLVISRGWQAGHPLTWEIQDVYAIQGNSVTFVRRRERIL